MSAGGDGTWAAGFLRRYYRLPCLDQYGKGALFLWAVFHSRVVEEDGSPVPPLPPMVLQMLNRASVEAVWVQQWLFSPEVTFDTCDVGHGWLRQPLTLAQMQQPNWWRSLDLSMNLDVESIAKLPLRLRRLTVSSTKDLGPLLLLPPFRALRHVTIERAWDLSACARIPTLTKLTLRLVTSVSALAASGSLVELHLSYTGVTSEGLAGLERIPTLAILDLVHCSFTSVSCLAGSTSLVVLDLSYSMVTSEGLVGLDRIPTLTKLDLGRCESVTSVSCLACSSSLVELGLWGTPLTSDGLIGLERIPTLRALNLAACESLLSVSCLAGSTSLVELCLSGS